MDIGGSRRGRNVCKKLQSGELALDKKTNKLFESVLKKVLRQRTTRSRYRSIACCKSPARARVVQDFMKGLIDRQGGTAIVEVQALGPAPQVMVTYDQPRNNSALNARLSANNTFLPVNNVGDSPRGQVEPAPAAPPEAVMETVDETPKEDPGEETSALDTLDGSLEASEPSEGEKPPTITESDLELNQSVSWSRLSDGMLLPSCSSLNLLTLNAGPKRLDLCSDSEGSDDGAVRRPSADAVYSMDEERKWLRYKVEILSRDQCIVYCTLGHLLLSPKEMLGRRDASLSPEDARQALLCLAVGDFWDVRNLASIFDHQDRLEELIESVGIYSNIGMLNRTLMEKMITKKLGESKLRLYEDEEYLNETCKKVEEA